MKKNRKWKRLGIILGALLLVIAVGYTYLYFNGLSGVHHSTQPQPEQVKIACVGDSITYGHGITGWPENNYPAVLQNLLGEGYHVLNFGVSGCTVQDTGDQPYCARDTYEECLAYGADIVVFMMGSNDSKPENWIDAAHYEAALNALLDSYGDRKIILCTPATAFFPEGQSQGLTNFDISPAVVEEIAEICRQVARERGIPLVDIHAFTADNPQWFEKDGVHPDNSGAAAIAGEIRNVLHTYS